MCTTLPEIIKLIENKASKYDWHCVFCGGSFGRLQYYLHSPEKKCEADQYWFYYVCRKCKHEWSVQHLVEMTKAGQFEEVCNFFEELVA